MSKRNITAALLLIVFILILIDMMTFKISGNLGLFIYIVAIVIFIFKNGKNK
jgi:hypothetical protein